MKQVLVTFCVCTTLATFGMMGYLTYKSFEQVTAYEENGKVYLKRSFCKTSEGIESMDGLIRALMD
jgi:hypothetical protein